MRKSFLSTASSQSSSSKATAFAMLQDPTPRPDHYPPSTDIDDTQNLSIYNISTPISTKLSWGNQSLASVAMNFFSEKQDLFGTRHCLIKNCGSLLKQNQITKANFVQHLKNKHPSHW